MTVRMLTADTRKRVQEILKRLSKGEPVTLAERIQLNKYALHIPYIAGMLIQAIRNRESTEVDT